MHTVEKNLEQQVKERDEKNSELDSKLNRLHKRAKQRIQEVQKVILFVGPFNSVQDINSCLCIDSDWFVETIFSRRKMTLRPNIKKSMKSQSKLHYSCQDYSRSLIAHVSMLMRHSKQLM